MQISHEATGDYECQCDGCRGVTEPSEPEPEEEMPDRDEIEKLAAILFAAHYETGVSDWRYQSKPRKEGYRREARFVDTNFVPRTEHELLVGAFRKEVKFWKKKYAEMT